MFETLLQTNPPSSGGGTIGDGNDGLDTLIAGTLQAGWYGVATSASMISGNALANAIGLSQGIPQNDDQGWLKFSYLNKPLYIAKKPFRYNVSWQAIYQAAAVYGDDTTGYKPSGGAVRQSAQVKIGSKTYRVRLMLSSLADPATGPAGRELLQLFGNIQANRPTQWASFTDVDLGVPNGTQIGIYSWCQETLDSTGNRVANTYSSNLGLVQVAPETVSAYYSWRPVLEPV